jgi:hypothetical protein
MFFVHVDETRRQQKEGFPHFLRRSTFPHTEWLNWMLLSIPFSYVDCRSLSFSDDHYPRNFLFPPTLPGHTWPRLGSILFATRCVLESSVMTLELQALETFPFRCRARRHNPPRGSAPENQQSIHIQCIGIISHSSCLLSINFQVWATSRGCFSFNSSLVSQVMPLA